MMPWEKRWTRCGLLSATAITSERCRCTFHYNKGSPITVMEHEAQNTVLRCFPLHDGVVGDRRWMFE